MTWIGDAMYMAARRTVFLVAQRRPHRRRQGAPGGQSDRVASPGLGKLGPTGGAGREIKKADLPPRHVGVLDAVDGDGRRE